MLFRSAAAPAQLAAALGCISWAHSAHFLTSPTLLSRAPLHPPRTLGGPRLPGQGVHAGRPCYCWLGAKALATRALLHGAARGQPEEKPAATSAAARREERRVGRMRWPKYWSFTFSISPSKEQPGLISFRMEWFNLLALQGTLKSLLQYTVQKHQFFGAQLSLWSNSHICT